MKRVLYKKVWFTLAAVAIFIVGMLRDPDIANADDLDTQPVTQEHMPGYQSVPDAAQSGPLTEAEIRKFNTPVDGAVPTF